ncbi:hypothetical protein J6TS1_43270 [Siminovitchia terrae]|uniref:YhzD-like protein n=1 Tax=Siminovitchia terrae TaxID=1914933 RepID=A0A429X8G1_SIMTE|nr:YhzD family protein [Siminovitchia terrae]RST59571.1 hypothetical protein D5F11_010710 [Siminovitchia terrae]GIN93170.1 hypothetical protein J22TS1_42210 [Siminovitchia terrae]GIN98457.1 hypothetical protein J6TS1_43270 [Siminovitchia terrae]
MGIYKITAFEPSGEKLLDESFEAMDDSEAKEKGTAILTDKGLLNRTHRCSSPAGKLLLFHR